MATHKHLQVDTRVGDAPSRSKYPCESEDPTLECVVGMAHHIFTPLSTCMYPHCMFAPMQVALFAAIVYHMISDAKSHTSDDACPHIFNVCKLMCMHLMYPSRVRGLIFIRQHFEGIVRSNADNYRITDCDSALRLVARIHTTAQAITNRVHREYVTPGIPNFNRYGPHGHAMDVQPEAARDWPLPYEAVWWTEVAALERESVEYIMHMLGTFVGHAASPQMGYDSRGRPSTPLTPSRPVYGNTTYDEWVRHLQALSELPGPTDDYDDTHSDIAEDDEWDMGE